MLQRVQLTALLLGLLLTVATARAAEPRQINLRSAAGEPRVMIVASDELMATEFDGIPGGEAKEAALLKWAAQDLQDYLSRRLGGTVQVAAEPIEGLLPIYIEGGIEGAGEGVPAGEALAVSSEFGDAYAVDISDEAIVLRGESNRARHYAAAELLKMVGVRWYGPGDLGEYVPAAGDASLPAGRHSFAPDFQTRMLWANTLENLRWALRNRMGGPGMPQGHAFAKYLDYRRTFDENQDWFPMWGGKVIKTQANLSNPEVVERFATQMAADMADGTNWAGGKGLGIGPDDGALLDERPESRAMSSGRIDPMLQLPSSTDLFIRFANKVAEKLDDRFADHPLGFYVYSNHQLPPSDGVEMHPMLFPVIAPITYNRYTAPGTPGAPTSMLLKQNIQAWSEKADRMGSYFYNFNLGDTMMPFTRTRMWAQTYPRLHEWGVRYATIESFQDGWHTQVPGSYVAARVLWDVDADIPAILDEFYPNYYGQAAGPMRQYHTTLEDAYANTQAYAGNLWSIPRILTPEVMAQLDAALTKATAAAEKDGDPAVIQRVAIHRVTQQTAEMYLAARAALNRGDLKEAHRLGVGLGEHLQQAKEKMPNYFPTYSWRYFKGYHLHAYQDAGRMAQQAKIIHWLPDELPALLDKDGIGFDDQYYHPTIDVDQANWTRLRTYSQALDANGFPHFRGWIWYRHDFELPDEAADAESVRLWLAGIDDTARVYLNGQDLGRHAPGRFGQAHIDLTDALNRDGENALVIAVSNAGITELGTGGLVRPAAIYVQAEGAGDDGPKDAEGNNVFKPLFGGE